MKTDVFRVTFYSLPCGRVGLLLLYLYINEVDTFYN